MLAIVTAALLTGLSPYFLFPCLVAAPLLLAVSRLPGRWSSLAGQALLLLAAIPALVIWLGLAATGETVMGLVLHPLFTVPVAFAALTLLPVLGARDLSREVWLGTIGALFGGALMAAVVAGTEPAYSAIAPLRLNVNYVEDRDGARAYFAADANAPLPAAMRKAAAFSAEPEHAYPFARGDAYIAPAGAPKLPAPSATVTQGAIAGGRRVTLRLDGSAGAAQMALVIPKSAGVTAITVDGKTIPTRGWTAPDRFILLCTTRDCRDATISLDAGRSAFAVTLGERRFGVPAFGAAIVAARPDTAVPSQLGDGTLLLTKVKVPAAN